MRVTDVTTTLVVQFFDDDEDGRPIISGASNYAGRPGMWSVQFMKIMYPHDGSDPEWKVHATRIKRDLSLSNHWEWKDSFTINDSMAKIHLEKIVIRLDPRRS